MKKGISLVALIITIIVLVILTSTVIYNVINENGVIYKAQEAKFKNDLSTFNEELGLYKINHQQEIVSNPINLEGYDNIKTVVTRFIHDYEKNIKIVNNELVYVHTEDKETRQIKWAREIGIKILNDEITVTISKEGNGTIICTKEDGTSLVEGSNVCKLEEEIILNAQTSNKTVNGEEIEYVFDGWYKNGIKVSSDLEYNTVVTETAIYVARFVPTNATLIYYLDANGEEQIEINRLARLIGYANRTDITKMEIGNNVTTIGENAFKGCTNLELTSLPPNLTNIGANAFAGCSKITINEIPSGCYIGNGAFGGCIGITSINMPKAVIDTALGGYQFGSCKNITNITIGSQGNPVTSIPTGLFYENTSVVELNIYVPETYSITTKNFGTESAIIKYYNATTGELLNVIWGTAYKGNTQINWTELPYNDKITVIRNNAFKGCTNLELTSLPPNLTNIGANAFAGCSKITINEIPSGCYIGNGAFGGCIGITSINMPKAVIDTALGGYQFGSCKNITNITIGSQGNPVTSIPMGLLYGNTSLNLLKIYIADGTTSLSGAKWGANNTTIEYYNATTGELIVN